MYYDIFKNEDRDMKESRIPSIYRFLYKGRDTFPSFMKAIDIEEMLIEKELFSEPSLIRRGFYADQIRMYPKYFRRDQIKVLGFRDLVQKPIVTLNKVCHFLVYHLFQIQKLILNLKIQEAIEER